MKKLNRTYAKITMLLFGGSAVCVPLGKLRELAWLGYAGMIMLIVGSIIWLATNRCPHCGAPFRQLYPFRADAGYCVKCGKKMEYQDR